MSLHLSSTNKCNQRKNSATAKGKPPGHIYLPIPAFCKPEEEGESPFPIPDIQSATSAAFRLCLAFCFTAECKLFMPHGGITHLRPFCTWQCNQSERREANNKSHNATLPHCHFPLATFHFHSSAIRLRRSSPSDRKLKSFVFISVI